MRGGRVLEGMEGVGKSSGRLLLRLDDMDVRFGCGKDT
jgi:hypothetical protein